jgi:transmembrane sensor
MRHGKESSSSATEDERYDVSPLQAEALDWLMRLTAGDVDGAQLAAFEEWRRASPEHQAAFEQARRLWAGLGNTLPKIEHRHRGGPGLPRAVALAAVVIFAAVVFEFWNDARFDYMTLTGERREVVLSDGSRLDLDSETAISVRFDAQRRRIILARGALYVDVVHDPNRPFAVETADVSARDIGTAFAVRRDGDRVDVIVERGRVEVARGAESALVEAAQAVHIQSGLALRAVKTDPRVALSWRSGRLIVANQTLSEIMASLRHYYPGYIIISANAAAHRVNGVVDVNHLDDWLDALPQAEPVEVHRWGHLVWVRDREK